MANVSLLAPPPPFSCPLCESLSRSSKAGPACLTCPSFKGSHYFPSSDGPADCDVLFVGDHPQPPPLFKPEFQKRGSDSSDHFAFQDDAGRVVRNATTQLRTEPRFHSVKVRYAYAVRCSTDTVPAKAIIACNGPFQEELAKVAAGRRGAGKTGPLVIVAHGVTALSALGLHVRKEADAQGKVYNTNLCGMELVVVFTRSLKAIAAAPGTYENIHANIAHAFSIAVQEDVKPLSREGMAAGHIYPTTVQEVRELVRMIHGYAGEGIAPMEHTVATDTETDTLYPTKGVTLTAVSFAWAKGQACAIPLWHKEMTTRYPGYDPEAAFHEVKWLWESGKPFVLHNCMYDLKVAWKLGTDIKNIRWDTMLAEHALREDAKGFYGLKELTAEFFPDLAGYQNKVVEIVESEESQEIAATLKEKKRPVITIPPGVLEALERLKLSPKFREATLQKKVDEWKSLLVSMERELIRKEDEETALRSQLQDATLVINAKKAGEFRQAKPKAEKKVAQGGYENVPLDELLFYAAVDADATRRLAVSQNKRMVAEDERIEKTRREVGRVASFGMGKSFHAVKRCETPRPRYDLVRNRYIPRARMLTEVSYHGFRIDTTYLEQARADIDLAVQGAQQKLFEMAGQEFKPKSGKQLQKLLCDTGIGYKHPDPERAERLAYEHPDVFKWTGERLMYRVPVKETGESPIRFTKTAVQMDGAFLKRISAGYKDPFADLNLAWRKAATIRDSFLKNIAALVEFYGDGWIRPGYNLNGTATGRLSSSSGVRGIGFNNQNIPKKPIGTVNCKKLFIADDDSQMIVNIDGAGAEVGVLTAYLDNKKDSTLVDAIWAGQDTHSFFSASILNPDLVADGKSGEARRALLKMAGIDDDHAWVYDDFFAAKKGGILQDKDYERRLYDLRENIKRVVFGTLFGAGPKKISEIAGIPLSFAKKVIELFFKRFPAVPDAIKHAQWCLRTMHFNETYFGRLRRFTINDAPSGMIARAERQGFNFLIQSTNSDIVLDVLLDITREIKALGGRLLGTVHDSGIFQIPKKYAGQLEDIVKEYGTKKVAREKPWLPVPFKWDIEVGPSYGELTKLKQYLKDATPIAAQEPCYIGYDGGDVLDDLRGADELPPMARKAKKP